MNGGVTGSWEILDHSQGAAVGLTGSLSITVSTNDGTFAVNNGGPDDHYRIVSPDGNMFAIMDTISVSADGTVTFTGNAGWNGIVSPDGQVMVLVDTDTSTAGEIHLGVAIKK